MYVVSRGPARGCICEKLPTVHQYNIIRIIHVGDIKKRKKREKYTSQSGGSVAPGR